MNDSQPMVTRIGNERRTGNTGETILKNLLDSLLARETSEESGCDNMTSLLVEFMWMMINNKRPSDNLLVMFNKLKEAISKATED